MEREDDNERKPNVWYPIYGYEYPSAPEGHKLEFEYDNFLGLPISYRFVPVALRHEMDKIFGEQYMESVLPTKMPTAVQWSEHDLNAAKALKIDLDAPMNVVQALQLRRFSIKHQLNATYNQLTENQMLVLVAERMAIAWELKRLKEVLK